MTPEQREGLTGLQTSEQDGPRAAAFFMPGKEPLLVNPPPGWLRKEVRDDGVLWVNKRKRLVVIASIATERDGNHWLHVSCSHSRRMPTYEEMAMIKDLFVGLERYAISVMPPKSKHVNIHPYCLHWWSCLDGHPLPEFSAFGSI